MVIALSAPRIATAWREYRSLLKSFDFKALAESEPNNSEDWGWPWQYAYVDLEKKTTAPLFDAPSAWGAVMAIPISRSGLATGGESSSPTLFFPRVVILPVRSDLVPPQSLI